MLATAEIDYQASPGNSYDDDASDSWIHAFPSTKKNTARLNQSYYVFSLSTELANFHILHQIHEAKYKLTII